MNFYANYEYMHTFFIHLSRKFNTFNQIQIFMLFIVALHKRFEVIIPAKIFYEMHK